MDSTRTGVHEVGEVEIEIGPLEERDIEAADRVFRLAFGTALGLPDPLAFATGADWVRGRWHADPSAAFKATAAGELVGSAFAARRGSVAILGPLTVHPDYWDRGVGRRLWEARMPLLARWGTTHAGLFTRPVPKNLHLYGQFGFRPGEPIELTARELASPGPAVVEWQALSGLPPSDREDAIDECRRLADAIYPGLDLGGEIHSASARGVGETVLVRGRGRLDGFAVCHRGEGSAAGPGACNVKFAAARPGRGGRARLARLLDACEELAAGRGLARLVAAVDVARSEARGLLLERGHTILVAGLALHRPAPPGYSRPGTHVLDEWR